MRRLAAVAWATLTLATACTDDHVQPLESPSPTPVKFVSTGACRPAPPDELINLPIAPPSRRVDLAQPTFSRPTEVTNPLFPIKALRHAVLVGQVDGADFRAETTLMPATKTIEFAGGPVQNLVSQYVAYLDGRLHEVALDWYAQADDGSVWYFGEDVFNYEDGKVADTHGTWISCKDGPPAMIMPARPKVGDVFRVENIFPVVFEEVEVIGIGQTVPGPLGPVSGAITVQQLHLDGSYAPKTFAPGYGEFSTGSGIDIEALAVAEPTDRAAGRMPGDLEAVLDGTEEAFEAVSKGNWARASRQAARAAAGWRGYQASGAAPTLLAPLTTAAIDALERAVSAREAETARQAAVTAERRGLDLLVRHAEVRAVDLARLEAFSRQLAIDADAEDEGGARGTVVVLGLILDRLEGSGDAKFKRQLADARELLAKAMKATDAADFGAVATLAVRLERLIDD
ncbi:MAG: hypothetical protein ACKVZ0_24130 [Gemmatimonadales bacterium]